MADINAVDETAKKAKEKLEKELEKAKNKSFAEPVIGHLVKKCEEDVGFAEDVLQPRKSWSKCFDYILAKAKKQASGQVGCAIRDDVVFEWAEDYIRQEEKEDKKDKEKAESKAAEPETKEEIKKAEKPVEKSEAQVKVTEDSETVANNATVAKNATVDVEPVPKPESPKVESKKSKKAKSDDIEGQMDFFDLLGMAE
jgi:hypothetical protein